MIKKIIYFDFDYTFIKEDLNYYIYYNYHSFNIFKIINEFNNNDKINLIGDQKRQIYLKLFFNYLKNKNIEINILSRNSEIYINKFLKKIKFRKYFTKIIGKETIKKYNTNKNKQKAFYLYKHHNRNNNLVLFVDDSSTQIKNVKYICPFIRIIHIKNNGINQEDIQRIKFNLI